MFDVCCAWRRSAERVRRAVRPSTVTTRHWKKQKPNVSKPVSQYIDSCWKSSMASRSWRAIAARRAALRRANSAGVKCNATGVILSEKRSGDPRSRRRNGALLVPEVRGQARRHGRRRREGRLEHRINPKSGIHFWDLIRCSPFENSASLSAENRVHFSARCAASDPKWNPLLGFDPMLTFLEQRIAQCGKPGPLFRTMR